ncbi:hypothetical protein N7466_002134 [Penicillium verhagenii]|uniref:uncharacterized protein n=1 Tax=Penicillium verhagenii TaxID=1562060 RepID=UPI00254561F6|nr:uncharacterized protein N7466_002134 [Penicillium verhagenii]KAJ5939000.1 hypothetical protein N7466_002134 [Penicillium verhagenii]
MATQDFEDISTISAATTASVDTYKETRNENDRQLSLENARALVRALENPADAIFKLFLLPTVLMAVKTASDLGIFAVLSPSTTFVTCQQLATQESADIHLVERIMRVLVYNGFAAEHGPSQYLPTPWTHQMTVRETLGTMDSLFIDFPPIIHKTPDFLKSINYQNPGDPNNGPLQYAYKTSGTCWDWLGENPEALSRFNTFMEGTRAGTAHWADWFPVQKELLDGTVAGRPLLVDVGGGRGHELAGFKERFPSAMGGLVLEDLPSIIDDIEQLDDSIQRVKHDFFTPQPVKYARVYYLKHIMHDWSDGNCRIILGHITAAMEMGYSKILIEDHIVPDQNAGSRDTLVDMIVMVWCPGIERTRQQWRDLLKSTGLVVTNFWLTEGHSRGIIQAELLGKPGKLFH